MYSSGREPSELLAHKHTWIHTPPVRHFDYIYVNKSRADATTPSLRSQRTSEMDGHPNDVSP
jgi:hypothetical protein